MNIPTKSSSMSENKELKLDFILKELTLSPQAEEAVPGSSSSVELQDQRLVCVEYRRWSAAWTGCWRLSGGKEPCPKRLELRFRPQDPFCHSLCGNRYPSSNLVLRVRRRVRKKDPKDVEIHMDILGVIATTYKFQGMADFQCLAVNSEGGKDTSLYDKIILRKPENQDFFEKPIPLFIPPASFSRLDTPVDYYFRPDVNQNIAQPMNKSNFIGLNRARRPHNAIFFSFNDPTVPGECLEAAKLNWKRVCVKESDKQAEEHLRQMFESRPIWSRNAVKANINIHPDKLKLLLPVFAYYMVSWGTQCAWAVEESVGYSLSDMPVKAKRSALNYNLSITMNKAGPQAASESSYIFKEGMLPPHRQMFYQLCDLDVESIKKVIAQIADEDLPCDERDGWCVLGTTDKLRDMISAMIKKLIRASKPPMPELPKRRRRKGLAISPGRGSDSEEENDNKDDEDEDEDDEFLPSEGSENEMETEILDYISGWCPDGGLVKGKNIRLGFRRHMDVFRGIPLLTSREGLRNQNVIQAGMVSGAVLLLCVLKATEYRNRCIQVNLLMTDTRGSEDCLYLNIWVPHGRSVSTGLPVMVWIFGGGFLIGGSMGANFLENYLYSGQEIADRGDVIVVTMNYRVGSLGFLSTGESDLPGNYGLWDQHAAIAWVNRNIRSFGGDPDRITVFGESAGGARLFKRAISQSGVALCPWAINKNPRRFAEEVAIKVSCPTDERMASCLKMTDPAALTLAGSLSISSSPDQPLVFNLALSPVIDGDFIPDDPSKLFNNTADIDYLAGVNNMDGHLFTGLDVPTINSPLVNTPIKDVKRLLAAYTKDKGKAGADNAYSTYTSNWGSNPSWGPSRKLWWRSAALYLHAANAKTGRTYSYLFSEPSRMAGIARPYPSWMGADHADDLQYVFGKPFSSPLGYWPRHRNVSGYIIAYWTNFAKTG
ncbi:hypothetical protein F7725_015318 [Dissostichus mawsoni]|uniref:Bile salt-activated lipase n=1 Tax=Dissostichus mawsoni TaxID=36200 RepID=A0A7J5YIL0_DISMA|nr:hypothetical protein F7725_015318 [Dissostichus mawsoni]